MQDLKDAPRRSFVYLAGSMTRRRVLLTLLTICKALRRLIRVLLFHPSVRAPTPATVGPQSFSRATKEAELRQSKSPFGSARRIFNELPGAKAKLLKAGGEWMLSSMHVDHFYVARTVPSKLGTAPTTHQPGTAAHRPFTSPR